MRRQGTRRSGWVNRWCWGAGAHSACTKRLPGARTPRRPDARYRQAPQSSPPRRSLVHRGGSIDFERTLEKIRAAQAVAIARIGADVAACIEAAQSETNQARASAVEPAKTQLDEPHMNLIGQGNVSEALSVVTQTVLLELTDENLSSNEPAQTDSRINRRLAPLLHRTRRTGPRPLPRTTLYAP